jgi:peptide methionine sulfoxide reductase MsrA
MESPFDKRDGVLSVTVGYTGGQKKNPLRYKYYRHSCGRDRRLQQLWGKEAGGH